MAVVRIPDYHAGMDTSARLVTYVALYRKGGATIWSCTLDAIDQEDARLLAWGKYVDEHADGDIFSDLPEGIQVSVAPRNA